MMGTGTNFDSPSAAAAYNTLGMAINDLNLDNISVGGLIAQAGRTDEEDRKKRTEAIQALLWAQNSARVSNQGLERLALHLNLECLWEDVKGGGDNAKTLVIAGQTMAVEATITGHIVHSAALAYNESSASLDKHVDKASAILLKDLTLAPNQSPMTKRLTNFRANLERLATLDKLSVTPVLNCHEVIVGIWESLEKLHRWDVQKLQQDSQFIGMPRENLRVFALCTLHGCPLMHTRGRIGLSLDYWKARRKLRSTTVETEDAKTWAILVECAPANGTMYPRIRLSDKWISDDIVSNNLSGHGLLQQATGLSLNWLEPDNATLPSDDAKPEGGLVLPKAPDVIFMATFDPPVIVPHGVAMEIYKISNTEAPNSHLTFDALAYPIPFGSTYDPSEPRDIIFTQTVPTFKNVQQGERPEEPELKAHRNTLYIYKPVYGQVLHHVPFAHPKDLISMLPLLRQYAFLSLLLSNSLKHRQGRPTAPAADADNDSRATQRTAHDEFAAFMGADHARFQRTVHADVLKVDITLTVHPVPRLLVVFPFRDATANVLLEVQLGGRVHVVSGNVFQAAFGAQQQQGRMDVDGAAARGDTWSTQKWADALELMEDLGMWIELIKERLE